MEIDPRLLRIVAGVIALPRHSTGSVQRLPRLSRHQTDPINRVLAGHIEHTLGRRLRLPRWVLADGAVRSSLQSNASPRIASAASPA
jgi:hypothetical protein